jgi:hypothetical protein
VDISKKSGTEKIALKPQSALSNNRKERKGSTDTLSYKA